MPTNLDVSVTADSNGITASPDTLQVPNGFDGTITWTLTGGTFLNPAITFDGEDPPSFELSNLNTPTTRVRRWGNFLEGTDPFSYYYTLHATLSSGLRVEHDPTVENEPPNTP
ncbi:MAG: hypothetical protein M3P06_24800 [Acidobacteriota bacterium]|nr:hypothetical protein [Acidobacteriota bacterium]